ncbi:hypothetical protein [Burkholderia ubonensis]|uniref:hypothetical protein n=1 Tax=Burkholderia ubonensis TaxID=101571 RepID=UPI000755D94B|nr:hypothetical protein [Burkholderia ubonensis]KUZ80112.1 hypothetical protein WI37_08240 [Burkholderia ubonensis]KVQ29281.1 hypothetical protein WK00_22315 [Burkholderia ubonensis]KVR07138.1 hypothetical protein WK09_25375 [Burkholderia ubonensis]
MRGLEIRAAFALATVAQIIDPDTDEMLMVVIDAECQGHIDYLNGEALPTMFADEPVLRRAWKRGHRDGGYSAELEACPHCNAGTGNPCPVHG